jgi:hypothetical protein
MAREKEKPESKKNRISTAERGRDLRGLGNGIQQAELAENQG